MPCKTGFGPSRRRPRASSETMKSPRGTPEFSAAAMPRPNLRLSAPGFRVKWPRNGSDKPDHEPESASNEWQSRVHEADVCATNRDRSTGLDPRQSPFKTIPRRSCERVQKFRRNAFRGGGQVETLRYTTGEQAPIRSGVAIAGSLPPRATGWISACRDQCVELRQCTASRHGFTRHRCHRNSREIRRRPTWSGSQNDANA